MKKLTTAEVVDRFRKAGLKVLGKFRGTHISILTKCLSCGHRWKIRPSDVKSGYGCPECARIRNNCAKRLSKSEVSQRYRRSRLRLLEEYQGSNSKYSTGCLTCGHVWKAYLSVVKSGCPGCAKQKGRSTRLSKTEAVRRYAKQHLLLLEPYKTAITKILTECLSCGYTWETWPTAIFSGSGCPKCARSRDSTSKKLSIVEVKARLKKLGLSLLGTYGGANTRTLVKCGTCGLELKLYLGQKCPVCKPISVPENEVRKLIESITGLKFPKRRPLWLKGWGTHQLELDGYNERHKVAFEYQGPLHYHPHFGNGSLQQTKRNDNRKRCLCRYYGITLIRIPYWKRDIKTFVEKKLRMAGLLSGGH